MRHALLNSIALVATLPLLACSPHTPSSAPTPTAPAPTETASATASPSDSTDSGTAPPTTGATMPATDCLIGPYRLIRFVQLGATPTFGTGEDGNIDVTFTGKNYTLRGGGTDPIRLERAGETAELTIDGTVKGTFNLTGDRATFNVGAAKGSATLKSGNQRHQLTMDEVAAVVAPDGSAQVACTTVATTLTFSDIRLELARYVR
jgi:hypothetical protein